jgi:predicted MFS family arabinose efflux permease
VFAPLTAALGRHLDWRATYPVLAGVLAVITIPAHLIGLRQPWPPAPQRHAAGPPNHIARSRGFVALTIAFALATGASYAIIVNLIPLMAERGISAQVLGRLGHRALVRHLGVRARTVGIFAAIAVTTALLGVVTSMPALTLQVRGWLGSVCYRVSGSCDCATADWRRALPSGYPFEVMPQRGVGIS